MHYLKQEEITKIIDSAPSVRDRIIIRMLTLTGISRKELREIDVKDIDFRNSIIMVNGRAIPVDSDTLNDIAVYVGKRGGRLICSQRSKTISLKEINMIVRKSARLAGMKSPNPKYKYINPTLLRRSFVANMSICGMPAEYIQCMVGHKSGKIMQLIRSPTRAELKRVYDEKVKLLAG